MSEQHYYPWTEGQPTKPDVDALMKAFPPESIKPGEWSVSDAEVRVHIASAEGNRYRTVCNAWARRLKRDHSIDLWRWKEKGFYCPAADEVFSRTHPTLEQAGRKIGRQLARIAMVRPTTDLQKSVQDHQGRLLHTTKRELRRARMNVLPQTAAPQQPRIEPPKKDQAQSG